MATKNVVPRANGEGELGTSSKQWKKVNAQQFTGSLGVSASFFEGDGSRLTGVSTGTPTLEQVLTSGNATTTPITGSGLRISDIQNTTLSVTALGGDLSLSSSANVKVDLDGGDLQIRGGRITVGTSLDSVDLFLKGNLNLNRPDVVATVPALTASVGVSASFFEGDGSRLTNVGGGSSFSVTGDTNNRVITADGSSGGVGEANLTFDGSTLGVTGDATVTGVVTSAGFTIGSAVITEGELERLDGASTTVVANKVVIADGSKNVATLGTVGCGAITSTGTSTFQNVDASVNVSASAFYGDVYVNQPGGGTYRPVFANTLDGEATLGVDASLTYNNALNTLYLGTLSVQDITSTGDITTLDISASVNVSASAFYGKQHVEQHGGGLVYLTFAEGDTTGEKQLYVDSSLPYNSSMNRLYVGTIQTNNTGYFIADSNASHPTEISGKALMYAIGGEMYVKDASGNQTLISPHDDDGEWQYYSRNSRTGKVVRIRMEKMIRALEELTGQTFIEEE